MSDPNAGVPPWVNIVVPILAGLIFILVLIWLFFTDKEIPVETLEDWVERLPLIGRLCSPEVEEISETPPKDAKTTTASHATNRPPSERTALSRQYVMSYDTISFHTASSSSYCNSNKPTYCYGNPYSVMCFESNV